MVVKANTAGNASITDSDRGVTASLPIAGDLLVNTSQRF